MISTDDTIQLPYTGDLTEASLAVARRAIWRSASGPGSRQYDVIRRNTASAALQLAFRRHLNAQGIGFEVRVPGPMSDPERYDIVLGGHACEIKALLISRPAQVLALEQDPGLLLKAPVLVPLDRHATETVKPNDIYIFGYVTAGEPSAAADPSHRGEPARSCWLHLLPRSWQPARRWTPFGEIHLSAEVASDMTVVLGGQDQSGAPVEFSVELGKDGRASLDLPLYSVSYLQLVRGSRGRLQIGVKRGRSAHVVQPPDWQNVWLEGRGLIVLGWLTREEFRARARVIPAGARVFQFERTRTTNLAVPGELLRPISALLHSPGRPH